MRHGSQLTFSVRVHFGQSQYDDRVLSQGGVIIRWSSVSNMQAGRTSNAVKRSKSQHDRSTF